MGEHVSDNMIFVTRFLTLFLAFLMVPCHSYVEILEYLRNNEECKIPEINALQDVSDSVQNLTKLKRRIFCGLVQNRVMTLKGDFDLDYIRQNLYLGKPERREYLIEKCAHKMETPEETAFWALLCFFR